MDTIYLQDIELFVIIGNNPEEKLRKQKLIVSVFLELDTSMAAVSDAIEDTVNYSEICKEIKNLQDSTQCNLIESFAEKVAQTCLTNKKVQAVSVKVEKPEAIKSVPKTGIQIKRVKASY